MAGALLTLLTDFGHRDPYVGVMKGVILGIAADARIVDLTHEISPQDVAEANFALHGAWPYFPPETVHVVVVDPGVGSKRRILAARSHGMTFLAPDNGALTGILEPAATIHEVADENLFRGGEVSNTFHGRDIFAPVAARLAAGLPIEQVGPAVTDPMTLERPAPQPTADGGLVGAVIHVDSFGNLISNIRGKDVAALPSSARSVNFRRTELGPPVNSYASVDIGNPLAIIESFGFLEIAINGGSAERHFNASVGDPLRVGPATV